MFVRDLLLAGAEILHEAGVDTPEIDSNLLLGYCLGKSRTELFLAASEKVDAETGKRFYRLIERRRQREPLAYIIGEQEFWSLDFAVTPHVLIPRPETELLLEKVISFCREGSGPRGIIVDLCCGSGAIAVVLAKELNRPVLAVDISPDALQVARQNSIRHGVLHQVSFLCADLMSAIREEPVFSCVVSNPPYVSREALNVGLQPEVARYEPHLALDGGQDGMEIIARIYGQVAGRMVPGAGIFMEIGMDQGNMVKSLFLGNDSVGPDFKDIKVARDYSGYDRIFSARKSG